MMRYLLKYYCDLRSTHERQGDMLRHKDRSIPNVNRGC